MSLKINGDGASKYKKPDAMGDITKQKGGSNCVMNIFLMQHLEK